MSQSKIRDSGMEATNMTEFCIIVVFEPAYQLVLGVKLSAQGIDFLLKGLFTAVESVELLFCKYVSVTGST